MEFQNGKTNPLHTKKKKSALIKIISQIVEIINEIDVIRNESLSLKK